MRPSLRVAALALLVLSGVTCTDSPTSTGGGGPAVVGIVPSFSTASMASLRDLAAFNLGIDNIHIHIDHPPVAAYDQVVNVTPDADTVQLTLNVQLNTSPEDLVIQLELRHGTQVLYSGSQDVTARAGGASATGTVTIPISYVGPGAGISFFSIAPRDTTIGTTHTAQFRLSELDAQEQPVSQVVTPVWTIADSALGSVAVTSNTFTATIDTGTTQVIATLPNGLSDTATVHVIANVATGSLHFLVQPSNTPAATAIDPPVQVEVLDLQGQRDSTGANASAIVALSVLHGPLGGHVGDSAGLAADTVHAVKGVATFRVGDEVAGTYKLLATSPGLNPDSSASYEISVGPPSHLQIVLGSGTLGGAPGDTTSVRPTVRVLDAGGNAVAGATVQWVVDSGGGGLMPTDSIVLPGATSINTTSDSAGKSAVLWTMGSGGDQKMHAAVSASADTAHFSATISVASGVPASLTAVGDSGLLAPDTVGTSSRTFTVQVRDSSGTAVSGTPVTFLVVAIGASTCALPGDSGSVSVSTDASGKASVDMQLPPNGASCELEAFAYNSLGGLVDGSPVTFDEIVAPARATVWMGQADSVWTNAANWSAGVPTTSDTAFLPWVTTNSTDIAATPTLNGNTGVGTLIMENAVVLEMHGDTLQVHGDLTPPVTDDIADWSMYGADTGAVEMMTPGSKVGVVMPGDLMIGDASMSCVGASPVLVTTEVFARNVNIYCPAAMTTDGTEVLGALNDVNLQHHGTLAMQSGQIVYADGNFSVTSDQSSDGLLTGGTLTIGGSFTQDTVAGVSTSYKNFFSTGTVVMLLNPDSSTTQTISATSDQIQFWDLTAYPTDSGKVQLSSSGASTYTIKNTFTVIGGSDLEQFTIPSGITLNVGSLSLSELSQLNVDGTLNASTDCDSSILAYIVLGANGVITPASCHP